jgi:1-acyl-sn-glycerol-3-phosphate acyltransferase
VRFLRSLGIWAVIVLATILCGLPAMLLSWVPPRGELALKIGRIWSRIILGASGVRVRLLHSERMPRTGGYVVAPNHESFYDILVIFTTVPLSLRFLAKRNLFRLPFLGWAIAAAGFVPVDRGDRQRNAATIETSLQRLAAGRSLIVFPEETRTRTGDLLPFKAGAALLAIHAGLPILPMGLAGTFRIQKRGGFTITPSEVAVAVGEPIEVTGLTAKDRAAVTQRLRESVASLREEARGAVAYNRGLEAQ